MINGHQYINQSYLCSILLNYWQKLMIIPAFGRQWQLKNIYLHHVLHKKHNFIDVQCSQNMNSSNKGFLMLMVKQTVTKTRDLSQQLFTIQCYHTSRPITTTTNTTIILQKIMWEVKVQMLHSGLLLFACHLAWLQHFNKILKKPASP